jgi:2-keto-3-deoxy-L-rhamnonate aldolase RhmA
VPFMVLTLEPATIAEMAVALGLDWIVIDAEHGHLDWREILEYIRATVRSNTVAFVRVTQLNRGLIKRALTSALTACSSPRSRPSSN